MTVQTSVSPSKISQNCDQNNLSVFAFVGDLDNAGHKAPGRVEVKRHVAWKEHPLPELTVSTCRTVKGRRRKDPLKGS